MSEAPDEAESPEPEDVVSTPDVDLSEGDSTSFATQFGSSEESAEKAQPDGSTEADSAPNKLEDADPEPDEDSTDDRAAQADRQHGIRNLSMMTGDRARLFQAEQISIFGGENSVVPRSGEVPGHVLSKLVTAYVQPSCAQRLLDALRVSPVQCLVGPSGSGRTTAAIATAARHLERVGQTARGNVHILATDDISSIDGSALPEGKAFILVLPESVAAPDIAWFGSIGADLEQRHSVLILVSVNEPKGSAALKADWLVPYTPPPLDAIFKKHLASRPPSRVDALCALPDVRMALQRCRVPRDAAMLAADVLADMASGLPDQELLKGEPTAKLSLAQQELNEGELWHRILLVATAVMYDLSAGTVVREAKRLAELHVPNGIQTEVPKVDWFNGPRYWSACVDLVGDQADSGAGQIFRLAHPRLAIPLLEVIWQDHVGERDVLLDWLCGLGAHPIKRVRVKAAQAAAQLACYDFDVVVREVIHVWALNGGFRTRQSAAVALEALAVAAEGRFARRVRGLVQGWAHSNNVRLLAAAMAAYGTFLGAKDPDEALARMEEIVGGRVRRWDGRRDASIDHVERELANIVQRALLDVFAAGAQEKVIQALARWAGLPHWRWRKAAARSLLELARKEGASRWPLLIELTSVQDDLYDAVLALWRNALDAGQRDEAPWEALRRWCDQADELRGDPAAAESAALTEKLLADIRASSSALADNLDFHQRIWAFRKAKRQVARSSSLSPNQEETP
ncbi:hypothetical protein GCM10009827_017050 [Dactylosporangium maewongense]|uniref:ATP-binding protein n=1 Tax=Dactylosporangium maewongense TaxID=634393 RepID=A0ABN1ZTU8_9ACTN